MPDNSSMSCDRNFATPCWQGYTPWLHEFFPPGSSSETLPGCDSLNQLLAHRIEQQGDKCFRFVPAGQLPAVAYEEHIFRTGEISTREGNWHDLFNALAWARFPRIKAAMNALHFAEIERGNTTARGRARDALTLFDECGVMVVGNEPQPLQALAGRDWQSLFCNHRSAWQRGLRVFILGHALLEKFLNPYKSITAQVMIFQVGTEFMQQTIEHQTERLDSWLAGQLQAGLRLRSSEELSPLPLMGIPGWCAEQKQPEFYTDLRVFRPAPAEFKAAKILMAFDNP